MPAFSIAMQTNALHIKNEIKMAYILEKDTDT